MGYRQGMMEPKWYDWMVVICLMVIVLQIVIAIIMAYVIGYSNDPVPLWFFIVSVVAVIGAAIGLILERIND